MQGTGDESVKSATAAATASINMTLEIRLGSRFPRKKI
jgi:hypothetical protein